MSNEIKQIHATCIAIGDNGILLRGPTASGKSDLALRLIDAGATLIADDRVDLILGSKGVCASAPAILKGLLEVRNIGILQFPSKENAFVSLVCELVRPEEIERMPQYTNTCILGINLPHVLIAPFETSSVTKVQLALGLITGSIKLAHDKS